MLKVRQFRYAADNLAYLVYSRGYALAVDGGAAEAMLAFLTTHDLNLLYAVNTHDHADHTAGNRALLMQSNAVFLTHHEIGKGLSLESEEEPIRIICTPGHTKDSACFLAGGALISGDTLFNGTIGNCFSGNLRGFYESIKALMALPPDTIIYPGHDYVRDSIAFARRLEPDNGALDVFLRRYTPDHVYSTLAEEFRINPYLRFNEPEIVAMLKQRGLPVDTEWDRWQSLMSVE